jgi:hypothetical protein
MPKVRLAPLGQGPLAIGTKVKQEHRNSDKITQTRISQPLQGNIRSTIVYFPKSYIRNLIFILFGGKTCSFQNVQMEIKGVK